MKLKDLNVSVEGTWLNGCLKTLNRELKRKGLVTAHAWISDEWFSPDNTPGIAMPFYLAHPRLARLERKMFLDVEGGTRRECMMILRHEAGHIMQHSYQLNRRRRWQELFGPSSTRYPAAYRANPKSRNYVHHLPRWYAQSHPDEDFAETFAVWLTPRSNWRVRYAGWAGAIEKLEYVDELMAEVAEQDPVLTKRVEVDPIAKLNKTLDEHYEYKLSHYEVDNDTRYDADLKRIFTGRGRSRSIAAASFIRENRADLRKAAMRWSGGYQVALDAILEQLIVRCRTLKLRANGSERMMRRGLIRLISTKIVRRASRRQWFAL
ncbi:MAG TPA: putative zinc-binding metallopeptidase [Hyphomonadaceae bacterium]|nr:putative zinc-binding metallopeptidase [Hyphomonadaceae bacterium]